MERFYIIKFGGSIVTDKAKPFSFRKRITLRLCNEIKEAINEIEKNWIKKNERANFVLIIGGGSFGHGAVNLFGLEKQYSVAKVREAMHELVLKVLNCMLSARLHAIVIQPSSFFDFDEDSKNRACVIKSAKDLSLIFWLMETGYIPVFYGDVYFAKENSAKIVSGDDIACFLAKEIKRKMVKNGKKGEVNVIFVSDVAGIVDRHGNIISEIFVDDKESIDMAYRIIRQSKSDVTGGIRRKLDVISELCRNGIDSIIVNGRKKYMLKDAILGKKIKITRFKAGWKKER